VEFGIFHEFGRPPGHSEAQAFEDALSLVDTAETGGLDAVWLAELHLTGRSVLSAPLTVASAIAARTQRVKIGIAVQVLPLCHPLRVAEETATVDHLSHGRLIFGVGRSGFARTYQAYGVPYAESRERFTETLDVLKLAWTEPSFSYHGTYCHFDNVSVVPKPYQVPHPPLRVAATSPDTFARLGALGYPIFVAVRLGSLTELAPHIQAYREAYCEAGHPGSGQVFLRVPVYLAETPREARGDPEASMMRFFHEMAAQYQASAAVAGAGNLQGRAEGGRRLESITYDEVLRDKSIVGTPDQVAEKLGGLRDQLGLDGLLAELNCGGAIPHAQVTRSLELLCAEVMPRF
jgi:alkanesulfonate monooxygenase SsuD/methylene tetrahydromethanopterin reductase-like flavin-dependent oxidoreductase (luciferase family)